MVFRNCFAEIAVATALLLIVGQADGQARTSLSSPSLHLSSPGQGSDVHTFRTHSYGLGALDAQGGGGTSLLRADMRAGGMTLPGISAGGFGGLGGVGLSGPLEPVSGGMRFGGPVVSWGIDSYQVGRFSSQGLQQSGALWAAGILAGDGELDALRILEAIDAGQGELRRSAGPIRSLVPRTPSDYQLYMNLGEQAFRAGRYSDAAMNFRLANNYHGDDPESHLSLVHAYAAAGTHTPSAAWHLQRALRALPELPLLPIEPRAFFVELPGNAASEALAARVYRQRVETLARQARGDRSPDEASFVLAYFLWFEGDVEATVASLREAVLKSPAVRQEQMLEAAETFWRAMVQTQRVSGELFPHGLPEPAASPGSSPGEADGATLGEFSSQPTRGSDR